MRPPTEQLWLVGVVGAPRFDGAAWIGAPNATPATNITGLRGAIQFESGQGISQDRGTLGMSLQTPRARAAGDVAMILAAVARGGAKADTVPALPPASRAAEARPAAKRGVIDGRYEIVRTLGKGGMGVVHEARHLATNRRVALKEILTITEKNAVELLHGDDLAQRLARTGTLSGSASSSTRRSPASRPTTTPRRSARSS